MPQPIEYTRSYDFTDYQANYPSNPIPAAPLDANLDLVGTSVNQVINRLKLIQRDDGLFKNKSVTLDSLSNTVVALMGSSLNPLGNWVTATAYKKMDLVEYQSVTYICSVDHTSGTFTTDKDAGKWLTFSNPAIDEGEGFYQALSGNGVATAFVVSNNLGSDSKGLIIFHDDGDGVRNLVAPTLYTIDGTDLTFIGGFVPANGSGNIHVLAPSLFLAAASGYAAAAKEDADAAHADAILAQAAVESAIFNNTTATAAPGVTNDVSEGYVPGSIWADVTHSNTYVCVDNTEGAAVWVKLNLVVGTEVQAYNAQLTDIAALAVTDGNIIVGNGTTWVAESGDTARASLGLTIGTDVQAYDADTVKKDENNTYSKSQRPGETSLTSTSASIAIDLSLNNDFTHTFTENTTLANPTNIVAGQSGAIRFTQHASSPKTLAFGSYWDFAGGVAPTVTASNNARDTLFYHVRDTTHIEAKLVSNWS